MPDFGRRPTIGFPPEPPPPRRMEPETRRRLRSGAVIVGAVGAITLSLSAAAEWRQEKCRQRPLDDPNPRPAWCDSHSSGHSTGHGWGLFSSHGGGGGSGIGHASFGGFGGHGGGHGGS